MFVAESKKTLLVLIAGTTSLKCGVAHFGFTIKSNVLINEYIHITSIDNQSEHLIDIYIYIYIFVFLYIYLYIYIYIYVFIYPWFNYTTNTHEFVTVGIGVGSAGNKIPSS